MVGVGIDASESSLARVSLVNYHGAVQLDVFVKQKERVVDYRTHVSGVRETDMTNGALALLVDLHEWLTCVIKSRAIRASTKTSG